MLPSVHRSLLSYVGGRIVSKNDAGLQWGIDDRAPAIPQKLASGGHLLVEGRPIPPVPPAPAPHIKFSDGRFDNEEEASAAYLTAKARLHSFNPNIARG